MNYYNVFNAIPYKCMFMWALPPAATPIDYNRIHIIIMWQVTGHAKLYNYIHNYIIYYYYFIISHNGWNDDVIMLLLLIDQEIIEMQSDNRFMKQQIKGIL